MTLITLPKTSQSGTNEWADVQDNDDAIVTVVNGQLTNENLSGTAGITDANLASPNTGIYRTLLTSSGYLARTAAAGTYFLGSMDDVDANMALTGASLTHANGVYMTPPSIIYFDDADFTVASKTTKLRVRAQVATNATASGITFTVGLYPVTVAGGAGNIAWTAGTVVTGSTVAIATPSASTITQGNSGDLTIPSDGAFVLAVLTSAQLAASSSNAVFAQLQIRHV